jgi:hypothetical protein
MSKVTLGRVFVAVIGSYLAFGLMAAVTEQVLSSATSHVDLKRLEYFVVDVIAQCLYLIGAGYLCSVIARSNHLAIGLLTALGLVVGTFSLVTSWRTEPKWYGIALLVTYAPCLWAGWAMASGLQKKLK